MKIWKRRTRRLFVAALATAAIGVPAAQALSIAPRESEQVGPPPADVVLPAGEPLAFRDVVAPATQPPALLAPTAEEIRAAERTPRAVAFAPTSEEIRAVGRTPRAVAFAPTSEEIQRTAEPATRANPNPGAREVVATPDGGSFDWADAGVGVGLGVAFAALLAALAAPALRRRMHTA